MRRPSLIALISVAILFTGASLPARAADPVGENGLMVILIDQGAAPVQRDLDVAETVALTMAMGTTAGTTAATSYGVKPDEITSVDTGPAGTGLVSDLIHGVREIDIGPASSDQFLALTDSFAYLTQVDAIRGSRVAMITSGRILGESENTRERLRSVADLFASEGWAIDVAALPSTEPVLRELMSDLAYTSGGEFYDTGTEVGLKAVFEDYSQMSLSGAMDVELHDQSASLVTLDIAPHTDEFSTLFIREENSVDVAVFSPNGTRATTEMENVDIYSAPSAVVVRIFHPVPGNWTLQGIGPASKLVAGVDVSNPLEVKLIEQPPLPVGEAAVIEAAAFNGESPQLLSGAVIEATVSNAGGTTEVLSLNDRGEDGDRHSNDGIYSVLLSAPKSQGINQVALKLFWTDYAAVIRSKATFRSESFPTLNLVEISDVEVTAGAYATMARVQVRAGDYPFLISPSELRAVLSGQGGDVEGVILTVDEPEPGMAWEFDIAAVLPESGEYKVGVFLESEFEGRGYKRSTPIASSTAIVIEKPILIFGLPVRIVVAIGGLMILVAGFAIWIQRKTSPYGYILDDQNQVVVDFARLRRTLLRRLFSKNAVDASELSGLPFEGGTFKFTASQPRLIHKRDLGDPSMRVNSRPAGPETELGADVWLGVGGRLFMFSYERTELVPEDSKKTGTVETLAAADVATTLVTE